MNMRLCFSAVAVFFVAVSLSGCLEDHCEREQTFIRIDPVYVNADDIRAGISSEAPRDLENPGNIYYYKHYLLVNELREGIHVIDNSDPQDPQNLGFISIKGNLDMAVKDNTLYADSYLDLLAIDIKAPLEPVLRHRDENRFENQYIFVEDQGYIVSYTETNEKQTVDCTDDRWGRPWFPFQGGIFLEESAFDSSNKYNNTGSTGSGGIAGSMARFALAKNHLYTLDDNRMHVFDLKQETPAWTSTIDIAGAVETLFPQGDYLFVGANNGMFIYDNSTPSMPTYISQFNHSTACDPVFVYGEHAFVTLRDGTPCQTFNNELDVVNISDINNPYLVAAYPMDNPHGLSISEDILYLCDGKSGLRVFDVSDVNTIDDNQLGHLKGKDSYDIIVLPGSDVALLIGADGLYQYDVSDPGHLVELSRIPVQR